MSKRLNLSVPDDIAAKLDRWADAQGRPMANLAIFLLEKAVERAEIQGDFTKSNPATIFDEK